MEEDTFNFFRIERSSEMRIGLLTLCSMSGMGGRRSTSIPLKLLRKIYVMERFTPVKIGEKVAVDYVFVLNRTEKVAIRLATKICKRKLPEEFKFRIDFKRAPAAFQAKADGWEFLRQKLLSGD